MAKNNEGLKAEGFIGIKTNSLNPLDLEKKVTRMRKEGKQSPVNLMMPEEDYKRMKVRIAMLGVSMKEYIHYLILEDLKQSEGK